MKSMYSSASSNLFIYRPEAVILRRKVNPMEITIFAKKRTNKEGKPFTSYITTLTKKNGEKLSCSVKFRDDCKTPKAEECPLNVVLEKDDCNLSQKQYTDEKTGEIRYSSTLWVKAWKAGTPYVDTSMDEYF